MLPVEGVLPSIKDQQGHQPVADATFMIIDLPHDLRPAQFTADLSDQVTLRGFHRQPDELGFYCGGDVIRTHGLYIANVYVTAFEQALYRTLPGCGIAIPAGSVMTPLLPSR